MQLNDTQQYTVFGYSPKASSPSNKCFSARGNDAIVVLVDTLPTEQECLDYAQYFADMTSVFVAPKAIKPEASVTGNETHFDIAWYNQTHRIQRCGHGTLAAAKFVQQRINHQKALRFHSAQESLRVTMNDNLYSLKFNPQVFINSSQIIDLQSITRTFVTKDKQGYCMIDVGNEANVKKFSLTEDIISQIGQRALIVTSLADNPHYDIIFRYFAPQYGMFEDQATGSAGGCLWPLWQKNSNNKPLRCYQASAQGGFFQLTASGEHVAVSGYITEK